MPSKFILIDNRIRIPGDVFDLPSFRRWTASGEFPEEGRFSFLDGRLDIDMSPEEISSHGDLKCELIRTICTLVRESDLGKIYIDRIRLTNEIANISNEPDLMFCTWDTLKSGRAVVEETEPGSNRYLEVVGSPDLVVEIVSKTSISKDTRILKKKYFIAGISEYWLIDARKKAIDFLVLFRGTDGFEPTSADDQGFRCSSVLPYKFKLSRERDRIGTWEYTLHHDVLLPNS